MPEVCYLDFDLLVLVKSLMVVFVVFVVFVQDGQVMERYYQVSRLLVLSQFLLAKSLMTIFVALRVHLMKVISLPLVRFKCCQAQVLLVKLLMEVSVALLV